MWISFVYDEKKFPIVEVWVLFCILGMLGFPGLMLKNSVAIISMSPSALTTTGIFVFSCHILSISTYKSLYLERFLFTVREMFRSVRTDISIRRYVLSLILFPIMSSLLAFIFLSLCIGKIPQVRNIINIIILLLLASFSHQYKLMVFHRRPSDSKSTQPTKTLLSILADHSNTAVRTIFVHPPISNFSSVLSKLLGTKFTNWNLDANYN